MPYSFKALVVDDEIQVANVCKTYKRKLKRDYDIDIDFDVINNEKQYDSLKAYDILLVDYDLTKGYAENLLGSDFIRTFRKRNLISKVVFYSSSFVYDEIEKRYNMNLPEKDKFDLINVLQIDRIAYKNNFNMMIDVIKSCCEQVDLLPLVLSDIAREYKREEIGIKYTNLKGEEVDISSLIDDLLLDNEEGKSFRKKVIDTVLSVLLQVEY